jgi:hypothetical protein
MAAPGTIPEEVRKHIVDNCTVSGAELVQEIKKKFGVDVTLQGVLYHVASARRAAEETTKAADVHLAMTIAERVNTYAPRILDRYEKEMERMQRMLDGTDPEFDLGMEVGKDGVPLGGRSKYWYNQIKRLYVETSKQYLALRPQVQTVRVESVLDPDVAAIESMTPEEREALEESRKLMKDRLAAARKQTEPDTT